jgi:hypothetical protein
MMHKAQGAVFSHGRILLFCEIDGKIPRDMGYVNAVGIAFENRALYNCQVNNIAVIRIQKDRFSAMTRILVFLSTFIIVVAAAGALYVFSGGDADKLRGAAPAETVTEALPVDAEALLEEASDYFLGEGVAQSDTKGAERVQAAADAGNQRAIGLLGTLYMGGIGVEQDFGKAQEWLALSNDLEGQELAANLMAFDAIVDKLPPEEKEKQINAARTAAHEQVRASFIAALRELRAKKETAPAETGTDVGATDAADAAPEPAVDETSAPDTDTPAPEGAETPAAE